MRSYSFLVALAIALAIGLPQAASAAKPTHRMTISGQVVDNWSISSTESCGLNGGGSVKFDFKTKRSQKVRPFLNKKAGKSHNKTAWALDIAKGGKLDNGWIEASGTFTTADNTTTGPNTSSSEPCPPIDRSGCGTGPVAYGTKTAVAAAGYDKNRLIADMQFFGNTYPGFGGMVDHCSIGGLGDWQWPFASDGGHVNDYGYLLPKMPSAKSLRKNKVSVATYTDHDVTLADPAKSRYFTDDVTRTITVTFAKL
jgi:hypothetical protein